MNESLSRKVERLAQLRYLRGEAELLEARVEELREAARGGVQRITGMPRGGRTGDPVAMYGAKIADLRIELEDRRGACLDELTRLYTFIDTIDDSLTRQVMIRRYVDGHSWQQIALEIGESDEQFPRRLHNKFLSKAKFDENDERNVL